MSPWAVESTARKPLVEALRLQARLLPEPVGGLLQRGDVAGAGLHDILDRVFRGAGRRRQRRRAVGAAGPGASPPPSPPRAGSNVFSSRSR